MTEQPWYQRYFGEEYLRMYAPQLPPERTEREVEEIVSLLQLSPGSAILDLCCGHGRHSIPLAQRGYQVTGQDLSETFLEHARRDAKAAGVDIRWFHSDMRQIPFAAEFDAAINIFTAWGYLEDEEQDREVLRQVCHALKPGGRFLMEIMHRDALFRRFLPASVERHPDGLLELHERIFDVAGSRIEDRITLIERDGRILERRTSVRVYTARETALMLESVGLEVEGVYGGLDGSPLTLESRRMAVLARKPA